MFRLDKINAENYHQVLGVRTESTFSKSVVEMLAEIVIMDNPQARVMYRDSELIGFVLWRDYADSSIRISQFALDSAHRGKGYASTILKLIINEIKCSNPDKHITLSVDKQNVVAIKLYQKHGFQQYLETEESYKMVHC